MPSALKNGVKQARLLLNPIVALGGALALSVKRFFELALERTVRESTIRKKYKRISISNKRGTTRIIAFGASIDDISNFSSSSRQFWIFRYRDSKKATQAVKIGTAFGVQSDTMVNVKKEARLLETSMKDISSFTNEVIGSGIQVNKVFEDLKAVSGDSSLRQTDQLMSQVLARKLGLNLNDIATISKFDFKICLQKE